MTVTIKRSTNPCLYLNDTEASSFQKLSSPIGCSIIINIILFFCISAKENITLVSVNNNLVDHIWIKNRPEYPKKTAFVQVLEYSGQYLFIKLIYIKYFKLFKLYFFSYYYYFFKVLLSVIYSELYR